MARLRASWRLSLSMAALSGNPTRLLQPETVSDLWLSCPGLFQGVAQQGCGPRPDLHQPNLALAANRIGAVAAFHLSNSVSESRRKPTLLRLTGDQRKIAAACGRVGLRHPDQPFDCWRKRQGRKRLCSCTIRFGSG